MGKGDRYRPVDKEKYAKNYDRIFGEEGGEAPPSGKGGTTGAPGPSSPDNSEEAERE